MSYFPKDTTPTNASTNPVESNGVFDALAGKQATITTLPIANGGTGSATQNFVDLSTQQNINGVKTFISPLQAGGFVIQDLVGFTGTHSAVYASGVVPSSSNPALVATKDGTASRLNASGAAGLNCGAAFLDVGPTSATCSVPLILRDALAQEAGSALASNLSYTLPAPILGGVLHFYCFYGGSGLGADINSNSGFKIKVGSAAAVGTMTLGIYAGKTFCSDGSFWYTTP